MNQGSKIYLEKYLEDFGKKSTVYTAIVEAVTNAIEAIEQKENSSDGEIHIHIDRDNVLLDETSAKINKITISDNGVGFVDANRNSFNTLYSQQKSESGGKGLGRMFFAKYFKNVSVESTYIKDNKYRTRKFALGRKYEIIEDEQDTQADGTIPTGAKLVLSEYAGNVDFDDDIDRFAHRVLEKILNYFVVEKYTCPKIIIHDGTETRVLNDLIGDTDSFAIQSKNTGEIAVGEKTLSYKMFELQSVFTQKSKIMLTANHKVVTDAKLEDYVPEFATDFTKQDEEGKERKYIVRLYVYGNYLDEAVNNERSDFNFGDHEDLVYPIGKKDIEESAAKEAKKILKTEVTTRFTEKKKRVEEYAEDNIWYKNYLEHVDFEKMKMSPSNTDIEAELHKVKFEQDAHRKAKVANLANNLDVKGVNVQKEVEKLVSEMNDTDRSNPAQYMAFRQVVLNLFEKALEWDNNEKFEKEKTLHSIIFPVNHDSDDTTYDEHNLWILDEKLNFTSWISSDKSTFTESADRPDIAAFHYPVSYREGEEVHSPVSIFEFKKPSRTDFINKSSDEDPIEQIVRYVNQLRDGKLKQPNGREIHTAENTPFYGYVIASANNDVKKWLTDVKDMKMTPDGSGWFKNMDNINLRVEFITWDKLLKDAKIRHRVFFEKLGAQK